jgi:hypothetical protein
MVFKIATVIFENLSKLKMPTTEEHNQRFARMTFAEVFPHYVNKIERKGRTINDLYKVIEWLTGFNEQQLQKLIADKVTFTTFFEQANLHPNAEKIKGVICGYRIEAIENVLTKKVRYLDKLVDELAKGKILEKILP